MHQLVHFVRSLFDFGGVPGHQQGEGLVEDGHANRSFSGVSISGDLLTCEGIQLSEQLLDA
jgi:hypothetical protein